MRTFTFSDATSNKFWNIELTDKSFTVSYGRIGAKAQTSQKEFATAEKAKAEHDKLVAEKVKKGYVETTAGAAMVGKGTREILESALFDNPDDLATHKAYADLLMEENDPRGEFIQIQLQLEDENLSATERKKLTKAETSLLKDHWENWLGATKEYLLDQRDIDDYRKDNKSTFEFRFERGWLTFVRIPLINLRSARVFTRSPATRLLRDLVIEEDHYEDGYTNANGDEPQPGIDDLPEDFDEEQQSLYPLFQAPFLKTLRSLRIGELVNESYGDYCDFNCQISGGQAADLVERMPNLEELRLLCHRVNGNKLFNLKNVTKLKILQIYHSVQYPLDRLAKNPAFANLTHLLLHPHALEEAPSIQLSHIKAICDSPHLKKLEHLQLRLCDAGDAGVKEIVKSGILKQLKVLDLRHGCISDEGAEMFAKSPDIKHLQWLDLSRNRITAKGIETLEKIGLPSLHTVYQSTGAAGGEFGEPGQDYLYAGDIE